MSIDTLRLRPGVTAEQAAIHYRRRAQNLETITTELIVHALPDLSLTSQARILQALLRAAPVLVWDEETATLHEADAAVAINGAGLQINVETSPLYCLGCDHRLHSMDETCPECGAGEVQP